MSTSLTGVTLRPITGPGELGLFSRLPYVLNDELADDLGARRRRPEWMWVALRGDRLLARLAWWGPEDDPTPSLLDVFDLDDVDDVDDVAEQALRIEVGVELLRTATKQVVSSGAQPPDYIRFLGAAGTTTAWSGGRWRTAWQLSRVRARSCSWSAFGWSGARLPRFGPQEIACASVRPTTALSSSS